jgi:hypothetical protein
MTIKRGRPKGSTSKRLTTAKTQISRAIKERDITSLLWAYITLSHEETYQDSQDRTFTGHNLNQIVTLLHTREIVKPDGNSDNATMLELQQWFSPMTKGNPKIDNDNS